MSEQFMAGFIVGSLVTIGVIGIIGLIVIALTNKYDSGYCSGPVPLPPLRFYENKHYDIDLSVKDK